MRHRAIAFSREWQGETREAAERQSFWNDFFNVFGVRRRTVATFDEPVKKLPGDWGYPALTLADLYDPLTMPAPLLKAPQQLDRAVARCYTGPSRSAATATCWFREQPEQRPKLT